MCSLGWKKGVMDSPGANTNTHILAPSFSSSGGRFDIEVRLEEEEPDLEPRDFKVRGIVGLKVEEKQRSFGFPKEERVRN